MKTSNRGFQFTSKNGNEYFYNDNTGEVTPLCYQEEETSSRNYGNFPHNIPIVNEKSGHSSITRHVELQGYSQLTLINTYDCNLRCKYCSYSGIYNNKRTHKKSYMTFEIAEKAIRRYFKGFLKTKLRNPYRIPSVGFYGGEPLLNFDLVRKSVNFAKSIYPGKIRFNITTNAILLSDRIIDFMHENDFILSISLNGPQNEHDRLRIFPDGSGTFEIVWKSLQKIRQKYPEYYKKHCMLIVTCDIGTDLKALDDFFTTFESQLPLLGRISQVSSYFTQWYDQYSLNQKNKFKKSLSKLKDMYFTQLLDGRNPGNFLNDLFGFSYRLILLRAQNVPNRPSYLSYTGTCIPGDKIAVDPNGQIHICERINDKFPIGDVECGLSIEKISKILKLYREGIYEKCHECPITRLCPMCYATFGGNGQFRREPENVCESLRQDIKKKFEELWTLFENGVSQDQILRNKFHQEVERI